MGRGPAVCQLAQHVGQIRQRRHTVLRGCTHEAVDRSGAARSIMRAGEEEVLPAERDVAQLLLAKIVVQVQAAVFDEARECRPLVQAGT
jgi:hypothetical protein